MAYNLLRPVTVLSGASLATDLTSPVVETKNQDNIGVQLAWTGNAVGLFGLEVSSNHLEDAAGNVQFEGDWIALPLAPSIVATGIADDAYMEINQLSAQYIRVTYISSSGTGSVTVVVVAKGV